MEASLKAMRKLTRESDHIVLISGLGVARAAGLMAFAQNILHMILSKNMDTRMMKLFHPCFCQKG